MVWKTFQTKGQVLRSKGILDFKGQNERFVFQGVHMLMDGSPMGKKNQPRNSRIVFIGRDINNVKEFLQNSVIDSFVDALDVTGLMKQS